MKKCRRCGAQYDGVDICPGCGSGEYDTLGADLKIEPPTEKTAPLPDAQPYEPKHYSTHEPVRESRAYSQAPPPPNREANEPGMPAYAPVVYTEDAGARGLSVASLVFGVLSILFCVSPFMGIVTGILGVCFGSVSKKRLYGTSKSMATGGFVTGLIGLILSVLITILVWIFIALFFQAIIKYGTLAGISHMPYAY